MNNKGVKSVFRRNKEGKIFGAFVPLLDEIEHNRALAIVNLFVVNDDINSVRVVVGNKVFEAHTDKYNNIIFRIYEKQKKKTQPSRFSLPF